MSRNFEVQMELHNSNGRASHFGVPIYEGLATEYVLRIPEANIHLLTSAHLFFGICAHVI
jgi:hypothetical protein